MRRTSHRLQSLQCMACRLEDTIANAAWLDSWAGVDTSGIEIMSWVQAADGR